MKHVSFRTMMLTGSAVALLGLGACGGDEADEGSTAGSAMENAAESALVELTDGSPIAKPFRLQGADPGDLDRFNALMASAEEEPFQIGSATFDDSIGAIVLTDVSNTEDGKVFTIGRAELFGVNFDYLEAERAGTPLEGEQELFRKIRLFDLTLSGYNEMEFDGMLSVEALELDRMSLGDEADVDDVMAGSFDLGGLYLLNADFAGNGSDGVSMQGEVADLRFDGISRGRIGPVSAAGIEYVVNQDLEEMQAALAEADSEVPFADMMDSPFRNLFFPEQQRTVIPALNWDGADITGLAGYLAREELPPLDAEGLISVGRLEATEVESYINGNRASYTEYSVLKPIEFAWLVPTRIEAESRGNVTDMTAWVPAEETEILDVLTEHGLDDVASEGKMLWTYDADQGAASLAYDVDAPGLANVDLSFGLSGATLTQLHQAVTTENPMMLMGMSVDGMNIRIEDREMLEAVIKVAALETEQDPQQLRESLPALLALGSAQAGGAIPEMDDYVAALSAFVTEGGTIEIAMSPDVPVPLMTLALLSQTSPQMIPSTLALTVTHRD